MKFFKDLLILICYFLGGLTTDQFFWLILGLFAFIIAVIGLTP